MNDTIQEQLAQNRGFAFNEKRQTACVFNQAAFDSFLKKNGLTHVVRAHEVKQAGFEVCNFELFGSDLLQLPFSSD